MLANALSYDGPATQDFKRGEKGAKRGQPNISCNTLVFAVGKILCYVLPRTLLLKNKEPDSLM